MTTTIRPVTADEFEAFSRAEELAFGNEPHPDDLAFLVQVVELDRTLAAFDGDRIVGTAAAITLDVTLPGGATVGCAGLTTVGVRPTHRRRGLLSSLMRHHLDDVCATGEPVAALYTSESGIYGRFGYGVATYFSELELDRPWGRLREPVDLRGRIELVDATEAVVAFPRIYQRARREGMFGRPQWMWRLALERDPEHGRDGASARQLARVGDTGYVAYRIRQNGPGVPDNTLIVEQLVAADLDAYAALWQYCLDFDLVGHVLARGRAADEPLDLLLADPRRLRRRTQDAVWLRLTRVEEALAARRYTVADRLTLALHDGFCPRNDGTWRLEGGPDGASCRRVPDGDADLELDAGALGAVYLGGERLARLARAGMIRERTAGAVRRADLMFSTQAAPWCDFEF